jgi:hypothetical protein
VAAGRSIVVMMLAVAACAPTRPAPQFPGGIEVPLVDV